MNPESQTKTFRGFVMRKKHTFKDRLKYMELLEAGYSVKHISSRFGIFHHLVDVLWEKYQKEGPSGLKQKQYAHTDGPFREKVLRDIENNCLTFLYKSEKDRCPVQASGRRCAEVGILGYQQRSFSAEQQEDKK